MTPHTPPQPVDNELDQLEQERDMPKAPKITPPPLSVEIDHQAELSCMKILNELTASLEDLKVESLNALGRIESQLESLDGRIETLEEQLEQAIFRSEYPGLEES